MPDIDDTATPRRNPLSRRHAGRHFGRIAATLSAAAAVTTGVAFAPATATADARQHRPTDTIQRSLDGLVEEQAYPGAVATVRRGDGRERNYTAGVGDLETGAPVPVNGRVRIGSNTKTFTAVVVLQLVGEGSVDLDAAIETYLPGLVRGEGIDGRNITVRQLLQHTSGLPDYDEFLAEYLPFQHTYWEPRQLLDEALRKPALFAPGDGWEYSNTNYIVAGLLVQRITGRPIGEEITNRIIEPLQLRGTSWPATGDERIRGRHPHGYYRATPDAEPVDVTVQDPSLGWAAGQMIGTPRDLITFYDALLGGELLEPAQLTEMTTTVDAATFSLSSGSRYGLGIATVPLSCGGVAWTHGGDIPGYETRHLVAEDGRAVSLALTALPTQAEQLAAVEQSLDAMLCSS